MTRVVFHRFDSYGPVCGAPSGNNAADFDPPEITCRRCLKSPPSWWERQTVRRNGSCFLADEQAA